jgi:hypothetical protein
MLPKSFTCARGGEKGIDVFRILLFLYQCPVPCHLFWSGFGEVHVVDLLQVFSSNFEEFLLCLTASYIITFARAQVTTSPSRWASHLWTTESCDRHSSPLLASTLSSRVSSALAYLLPSSHLLSSVYTLLFPPNFR